MFAVGELIFYGNEGVCRVEAIGVPPLPGVPDGNITRCARSTARKKSISPWTHRYSCAR